MGPFPRTVTTDRYHLAVNHLKGAVAPATVPFLYLGQTGDFFQHVLVDPNFAFQVLGAARLVVRRLGHIIEVIQDHLVQFFVDNDVERIGPAVHGQSVLFEEAHVVVGVKS